MAERMKVSLYNPDGSNQDIGTFMEIKESKEPLSDYSLEKTYFNYFKEKIAPVFTKTIRNLLNTRNHLLLQLELECGNISEEYFDKEEPKYLSEIEKIPLEELEKEIKLLFGLTNLPFDAADISEILNCPVDDAEKVINQYINGA